jgi:endonuclease/exonuclease/phosphatase family metal-dependent hydrolase
METNHRNFSVEDEAAPSFSYPIKVNLHINKLHLYRSKKLPMRLLFAALLIFSLNLAAAQEATMNVMTFNIRYPNPDDGFNYWPKRKELAASMIRFHEADLVGLQEAYRGQLDDLEAMLPGYRWFGVCRTDGSTTPDPDNEFSAILYRSDRFELLEGNTFWLSPTPDEVASMGWDAALPRIVTWARFRDLRTDRVFYHFNTHFDHRGEKARVESAGLLIRKIAEITGGEPIVVTGDFNSNETSEVYQILTDRNNKSSLIDALTVSETPHHGPMGTGTRGFQFPGVPGRRIDFIFIRNNVRVLKHANLSDSWGGRLPSDHLPVLARIQVSGQ